MKLTPILFTSLFCVISLSASKPTSIQDIALKDIDGKSTSLKAYAGKVVLMVNVASECGLTRQYRSMESIYRKYKSQGLVVLGFPCNEFGGQEPGSNAEIKAFCSDRYDVSFPMMDKVKVKSGSGQHPLYAALTGEGGWFPGNVKWNFGKFLIGRDGKPIKRFEPGEKPDSSNVVSAIETALKAK